MNSTHGQSDIAPTTNTAEMRSIEKDFSQEEELKKAAINSPSTFVAVSEVIPNSATALRPDVDSSLTAAAPSPPADDDETVWSSARRLYMAYFLAAWGARMWEFAGIVFIMDALFPSSLMASSLFGLFEALAGIFGSGPAGALIDTRGRLTVIRMSIAIQNISVIIAMGILCTALLAGGPSLDYTVRVLYLAAVILLGVTAKFGSMLDKVSINKDWLVVIAGGNKTVQSQINASMRRIDLVCQIVAPMGVGLGSSFLGPATTCILVAGWALVSLFVEFNLAGVVYAAIPALAVPKAPRKEVSVASSSSTSTAASLPFVVRVSAWLISTRDAFVVYRAHECFWISIPYCMLYMSVLSFGGIMVSYLKTLGCSDDLLSLGRGLAALVAIGPTFVVPSMIPTRGLFRTGFLMIWLQITCLVPMVLGFAFGLQKVGVETKVVETYDQLTQSVVIKSTTTMPVTFIVLVFVSICLSRFGLWGFDLSQTQMMQELIANNAAGQVNGAQELMLNFCWLFSFALTMIFADPSLFMFPTYVSFAMVLGAALVYTLKGMKVKAAVEEMVEMDAAKAKTDSAPV